MTKPYFVSFDRAAAVWDQGDALRVIPATFPYDAKGVAIFSGQFLKLILTEEHALDLSNLIADTLEGEQP